MSLPTLSDLRARAREIASEWMPSLRSLIYLGVAVVLILAVYLFQDSIPIGPGHGPDAEMMQTSRMIALAMGQYANDHQGTYAEGKSSTEIFQKLITGGYIKNVSLLYVPMAGKIKPVAGQPLKPENVCWDVTSPVDFLSTPDGLPLVFSTGYKVSYAPRAAAVPLVKPYPAYGAWWVKILDASSPGIAVCYKSTSAEFRVFAPSSLDNPDGSIPNFIAADFDAQGKTYRQLTPDGAVSGK